MSAEPMTFALAGSRWVTGSLIGTVRATRGSEHLYAEKVDLSNPGERARFAAALGSRLNGTRPTGFDQLVEQQLLELLARGAHVADAGERTSRPGRPTEPPWPDPPHERVYYGLAGRVTRAILPYTEADPLALLISFLAAFGNAAGTEPHYLNGADRHSARLFAVLVGRTAKARKGSSWSPIRWLFARADQRWAALIKGGLSSGEGLIAAVRDRVEKDETTRDGEPRTVVVDEGVEDKRLLVVEPEFGRALTVMLRQGNTLSYVIRDAWDTGDLRVMTKQALTATGAHISLVGHVTLEELRRELTDVAMTNGFANRLLLLVVRRSKDLPNPEPFDGVAVQELAAELAARLMQAQVIGRMRRDVEANELWCELYADLARERDGLAGALLARAEAHVLRLSLVYALLDASAVITLAHLGAAVELWNYCERSLLYVFGDRTGDPVADTILAALRQNGPMTRTQIRDLFGRHEHGERIDHALATLLTSGGARSAQRQTGGRPVEEWEAVR